MTEVPDPPFVPDEEPTEVILGWADAPVAGDQSLSQSCPGSGDPQAGQMQ